MTKTATSPAAAEPEESSVPNTSQPMSAGWSSRDASSRVGRPAVTWAATFGGGADGAERRDERHGEEHIDDGRCQNGGDEEAHRPRAKSSDSAGDEQGDQRQRGEQDVERLRVPA